MLSQYIKDTGDLDGVMEFLRTMVSSGKLSQSDRMSYIAGVLNNLHTLKSTYSHHEVDPAQKLRHHIQEEQEENEAWEENETYRSVEKIKKIKQEQENLNKSKQEIDQKIKVLNFFPLIYFLKLKCKESGAAEI